MPKGNAKGSAFERSIATALSLWWSGNYRDDWFYRTAGSGGRATMRAKRGKTTSNSAGDIGATTPEGGKLLSVVTYELKRGYNGTNLQDLIDKPDGPAIIRKFLDQAKDSAALAGTKLWAIIWRRDRREPIFVGNHDPSRGVMMESMSMQLRMPDGTVIYVLPFGSVVSETARDFYQDAIINDKRASEKDIVL